MVAYVERVSGARWWGALALGLLEGPFIPPARSKECSYFDPRFVAKFERKEIIVTREKRNRDTVIMEIRMIKDLWLGVPKLPGSRRFWCRCIPVPPPPPHHNSMLFSRCKAYPSLRTISGTRSPVKQWRMKILRFGVFHRAKRLNGPNHHDISYARSDPSTHPRADLIAADPRYPHHYPYS